MGVMGLGSFSLAHISLELFATCVCHSQESWQHLTHSKSIDKALRERGKKYKNNKLMLFVPETFLPPIKYRIEYDQPGRKMK